MQRRGEETGGEVKTGKERAWKARLVSGGLGVSTWWAVRLLNSAGLNLHLLE